VFVAGKVKADDAEQLFYALRTKVLAVKDFTADVKMKIDVSYMKIPLLRGKLYFKAPDKMKLERNGGVSILPKKNVNLTLGNLLPTGKVTVIDAGNATIDGKKTRILKVIPEDDLNNIILTKIWVDEASMLAVKTETTTRNEGTIVMSLTYGRYTSYSLPDKVIVYMDLKDYKLPKGVTMDYGDTPPPPPKAKSGKGQKGTIEVNYLKYAINTGIPDAIFQKKE
jgi:outer membrane lipoprotein-sorting protein